MFSHAGTIRHFEAPAASGFGVAWLLLCAALAVHVADEAFTGFLSVYNPAVIGFRSRFPFIPVPTFTFRTWLTGLILGIALVITLAPLAFRGGRLISMLAYVFGIMMLANGLLHIGSSIYLKRFMPGVYSAPLLLAGSLYLLDSARHYRRNPA